MRNTIMDFCLILGLVFFPGVIFAQGSQTGGVMKARTIDDFKPTTLKEVVGVTPVKPDSLDLGPESLARCQSFLAKVRVKFQGQTRPMMPSRKDALSKWALAFASNPEGYTDPYQTEFLFVEDGSEYWVAMNKVIIDAFQKEIKKGEEADLYLMRFFGAMQNDKADWVLLVEQFRRVSEKKP